ncbi:hypothetical protein AAVH_30937, partial [Aphelenchoides avenae]
EILLWLTGYFKYRAATAPVFFSLYASLPTSGWLLTIVYFVNYLVPFTAKCTNFLLTLNRFTLVRYNAITHIRIWRWLLPTSVAASFAVGALLNAPIFFSGAWMIGPTSGKAFYTFESDTGVEYRQSLYSVASILTLGTGTLVLNLLIGKSLWQHMKEQRKVGRQSVVVAAAADPMREAEAKLCVMTFVMFLTNIVAFVCQMIFFVYGGGSDMNPLMVQTLSRTQNFSEDLHIMSQPWMLIAMSQAIRRKVLKTAFLQSDYTSTAAFVQSFPRNSVSVRRQSVFSTRNSIAPYS